MNITVDDIRGVVGILPTPATSNADRWDAENTVNLPESEKMVRGIVDAGTNVIMTTGTFGQGATLTFEELRDFVDCVVQTTAKRRPVFAGVTTLNTRDTIKRARAMIDVGADGLFLGRPMWISLDDRNLVKYYRDLAEALPGVPFVIYDNPLAFKGNISPEAYEQLATIPQIVASKHATNPQLEPDLAQIGDRIRILPFETQWSKLAVKYPDAALACWSGAVACAPAPINALARAIARRDWQTAEAIGERVNWAVSPMISGGMSGFMDYSIQLGRERFLAAGFIDPGPSRPPYTEAPEELKEGSRECGRRWATLQAEFEKTAAGVA
jgi:4-(2-carboxyphenyl)-2-oxobut-3-enoate aldolase